MGRGPVGGGCGGGRFCRCFQEESVFDDSPEMVRRRVRRRRLGLGEDEGDDIPVVFGVRGPDDSDYRRDWRDIIDALLC